jgi:hypothetical protein
MPWLKLLVLYVGVFDAALIMAGGLATALVVVMGWDAQNFWDRIWPATFALIGSNVAAVLVLWVTTKFL